MKSIEFFWIIHKNDFIYNLPILKKSINFYKFIST